MHAKLIKMNDKLCVLSQEAILIQIVSIKTTSFSYFIQLFHTKHKLKKY